MNRGLASPLVHSALPMTRRLRLQLLRVVQISSLKRRAASPVIWLSARASANSAPIARVRRTFLASPKMKSIPLASHHTISGSRAKPESPRSRMRVRGQRRRIWATTRATSSTAPAEASMLERRSLAASR